MLLSAQSAPALSLSSTVLLLLLLLLSCRDSHRLSRMKKRATVDDVRFHRCIKTAVTSIIKIMFMFLSLYTQSSVEYAAVL